MNKTAGKNFYTNFNNN